MVPDFYGLASVPDISLTMNSLISVSFEDRVPINPIIACIKLKGTIPQTGQLFKTDS